MPLVNHTPGAVFFLLSHSRVYPSCIKLLVIYYKLLSLQYIVQYYIGKRLWLSLSFNYISHYWLNNIVIIAGHHLNTTIILLCSYCISPSYTNSPNNTALPSHQHRLLYQKLLNHLSYIHQVYVDNTHLYYTTARCIQHTTLPYTTRITHHTKYDPL